MTDCSPKRDLPRILCFHGDGTNADIFYSQTRVIRNALVDKFDLVYINGPFECDPGYGVSPFFDDCGPYFRWLQADDAAAIASSRQLDGPYPPRELNMEKTTRGILDVLRDLEWEFGSDERAFAGIMGFSSSAGVVAGILQDQCTTPRGRRTKSGYRFSFSILINGHGLPLEFSDHDSEAGTGDGSVKAAKIQVPTLLTCGLRDEWLCESRKLVESFDVKYSTILDLDSGHEVPTRPEHVTPFAQCLLKITDAIDMQ